MIKEGIIPFLPQKNEWFQCTHLACYKHSTTRLPLLVKRRLGSIIFALYSCYHTTRFSATHSSSSGLYEVQYSVLSLKLIDFLSIFSQLHDQTRACSGAYTLRETRSLNEVQGLDASMASILQTHEWNGGDGKVKIQANILASFLWRKKEARTFGLAIALRAVMIRHATL